MSDFDMGLKVEVLHYFSEKCVDVYFVDDDMISSDDGLMHITIDEVAHQVGVSFNVNFDPAAAANVAIELSETLSGLGAEVVIYECYAFEFDQVGRLTEVTFGDDAYRTVGREPFDVYGSFDSDE